MATPVHCMTVYERVTRRQAITQNDFICYFNETAEELVNAYGAAYVLLPDSVCAEKIKSIYDECNVDDRYTDAMVYSILYLTFGNEEYLSSYQSKAQAAYLNRWRSENQYRYVKGDVRR